MNRGTWRAMFHRIAKCRTRLKRLSVHTHTQPQSLQLVSALELIPTFLVFPVA